MSHLQADDRTEISESEDESESGLLLGGYDEEGDHNKTKDTFEIEQAAIEDPHVADLGGTLSSATLGIIKGMVGPAILYLPHGFAQAGYLVAIPVLVLCTALFLWSSGCLLQSWRTESDRSNRRRERRRLSKKTGGNNHPSGHTQRIMLSYPELAYRAFGSKGEKLVQVGISLMQSGVCLTYLIFVPQNLRVSAFTLLGWDISTTWTLALMVAVQIPLSWIRDIRKLTVTNLLANVLILYGLITCLGFAVGNLEKNDDDGGAMTAIANSTSSTSLLQEAIHRTQSANVLILYGLITCLGFAVGNLENNNDDDDDDGGAMTAIATSTSSTSLLQEAIHRTQSLPAFNPSGWFLFLGTSVLLFEGSITLLVPLQEAVQTPSDRAEFPKLYSKVILGIVSFYSFFGMTCWMAFGEDVRTVMTTSLPPGTLASTVQLAYSLAVVFTFPLQNFPSLEIVCSTVEKVLSSKDDGGSDSSSNAQRNVISTLLVILLSIIAILTMNDLDKVVSLMGSLLGCPLAFVIPPLIQNQLAKGEIGPWTRRVNVLVAIFGVGAMAVSSTTTIMNWE
eukprot:CAMPEP_0183746776 /NCGR_PEP_ID=MMETSP0737-20130205/66929_1 /TAXON_ID=385413 /ORGANISM="Thalassiosira miniscula, Strain CCMP1093" /LENGTH=562 /DNA_ID=CAMNT_0025982481 /DNA_START=89 /DNA_END=1777 /DNA_ORIENTATION=+